MGGSENPGAADPTPVQGDGRSLASAARAGARSSVLTQVAVQMASALATVILARLLLPADFGTVALAQSLMGAATLISLGGITAALITTAGDVGAKSATYFWLALGAGLVLAGTISALAPMLSALLGQGTAAPYVMLLTLTLPLSLCTLTPQALLQRRLQFSRANAVTGIGALAYFVVEIVLAILGWGAWAVIVGQVTGSLVSLITAMVLARWLPLHLPAFRHVREDFGLLANMGLGSFLTYLAKNADYWVVSRSMGAAALGVYYIAYVLPSIVRLRLSAVFRQVMLPIMSRITEPEEQQRAWGRSLGLVLSLSFPVLFGIAAVSEPLVRVFFGEQWRAAAVPMQIVTVASVSDIVFNAVATLAIARKQHVFRTNCLVALRAILIAVGAVAGATLWGLPGVAGALLVASLVSLVVQEVWISRPLGVGVGVLGLAPLKALLLALVMAAVVVVTLTAMLSNLHPVVQLLVAVALGVVVYTGLSWIIAKRELTDTLDQLGKLIRGR